MNKYSLEHGKPLVMARNKVVKGNEGSVPESGVTSSNVVAADDQAEASDAVSKTSVVEFNGYVVAIGASAGGLDALERFFDELSPNTAAAYVVIQHLSPDHKSMMDNLLARHTSMPVIVAENGMQIRANHVFLIPPGKNMTVAGTQLQLIPKSPHVLSLPIDLFFSSLSKEFGNRSIGIVLSGTGSDGTRGAVAINDAGGFLLAQNPESAKFDGMPRSVIATGVVDEVMPPEALASRVAGHVSNAFPATVKTVEDSRDDQENPMEGILHLLYQVAGINFKEYKPATVQRRIERRMQIRHVRDLQNYLHLLEGDRNEILTLKRDTLIPVTSFFRDSETFELLNASAIQTIIEDSSGAQPIRVWIAGCATGEEAYTIAILFAEAFDRMKRWPSFKIFATDVEPQSVEFAGAGVYPDAIANELSPERLERFFTRQGNQYVVKSDIRQSIVFARHNILEDPPFTRMNLVSCRNTLIYFDTAAQEKALLRFQYALIHNGFLLLGSSESLGAVHRDFSVINAKHKIYRVLRPVSLPLDFRTATRKDVPLRTSSARREIAQSPEGSIIEAGLSQLIKRYTPPALLLNAERELLHVYGDAQRFMQIPEGTVSLDISKLLIGKLAPVGVALLHKSAKENAELQSEIHLIEPNKALNDLIRVIVRPIATQGSAECYFLMLFETLTQADSKLIGVEAIDVAQVSSERIQSLERDLSATRDSLQATIEELETANEELQATNEELMASNEELQSTNEELQSVNEELYTVNSENQEKIEILNRLNTDLDNMTRAALIPTVFVDATLKLTRFTPEAGRIFRIREGDIGRPIDDFTHDMDYPEFLNDIRRVIQTAQLVEREVSTKDGRWYVARALPYIDRPRNINGAVLTFFEISQIKDAQRLQAILDSLPEHIATLDHTGTIVLVNRAWRELADNSDDRSFVCAGPGTNYLDACCVADRVDAGATEEMLKGIRRVLAGEAKDFSVTYRCNSGTKRRSFLMHATPVRHLSGGVVVSHINVTSWIGNRHE